MEYKHPDRIVKATFNYDFPVSIDWKKYKAVVVECDDWGTGIPGNGLETVDELEDLYNVLEKKKGCDNQPSVFTAFACMSNPDYDAIRESGFTEFIDKGPDKNSPVCKKWREGVERGVFFPEYHSNFHHTSPVVWMDLLRGEGEKSERARELFDKKEYAQGYHIPEFLGMNIKEMNQWVKTGVERFYEAVGYMPSVAVTSDAYPETEIIWSIYGIKAVSLKNAKNNSGEVVVYHTKPWNNQNPWVPMGAFNRFYDLIYLTRNVFFESTQNAKITPEYTLSVIKKRWEENEPAVIQSHRTHYLKDRKEEGLEKLERLLNLLSDIPDVRFLTSAEVASLYRKGWSVRTGKRGHILRKWTDDKVPVIMEWAVKKIVSIPEEKDFSSRISNNGFTINVEPGDYIVEPR